ncbi:MAG: hypothetical protein ABIO67_04620 [Mycobacteriales bacterium]
MTTLTPTVVLAHGVGTRTDLPIPTWLALYGAGSVVLVSFLALVLLWRTARLADPDRGRAVPRVVQAVVASPVMQNAVQAVTLLLGVLVLAVALAGPSDDANNLGPWVLYVTFWVGLIPASLLLGPVWRYANPLRLVHRLLAPLAGSAPAAARVERLGLYPAAGFLSVFVWLELVFPHRSLPGTVAVFIVVYAVVQLVSALWFGEGWFERGDGFEVYSTLLATLSVWGVRPDGRWVLRNPLRNVATRPVQRGLTAVVVVLLGSTAFDGLSRTQFWMGGPGSANDTTSGTIGLLVMIAIVGTLYVGATVASGRLGGDANAPSAYAHSVIPIAVGYAIAHYFSLLLLDGQTTWILASNPFGQDGVNLFGTYDHAVNFLLLGTTLISLVQVGAIVIGHVLGVFLAHDRSLRGVRPDRATYAQLPLIGVMVAFTVGGLGLLFGA